VPTTAEPVGYGQQVRGQAWALRALALADTFLPDASILRQGSPGISAMTQANFTMLKNYYAWVAPGQGQLAVANPATIAPSYGGYLPVALWQQGYLIVILGMADRLGYADAKTAACYMLDLHAGLYLNPTDYPPFWAVPFEFPIVQPDGVTKITTYAAAKTAVAAWYLADPGFAVVLDPNLYIGGLDAFADRIAALRMGVTLGHATSSAALAWIVANPDPYPGTKVKAPSNVTQVITDAYAQANPSFVAIA
jgi:hypothetical protein